MRRFTPMAIRSPLGTLAFCALLCAVSAGGLPREVSFLSRRTPSGAWANDYPLSRPMQRSLGAWAEAKLTIQGATPGDVLEGDGAWVNVTWTGVATPKKTDWIAIYCTASSPDADYLDYFYNTNATESGTHQVYVTNMRDDFQFRYISDPSNVSDSWSVMMESNVLNWTPRWPLQARLAYGDKVDTMILSWNSDTPADSARAVVKYGKTPSLGLVAMAETSHTYAAGDMCNGPANYTAARYFRSPGYFHVVELTDLEPSTVYYYSYSQEGGHVSTGSFRSAPSLGADQETRLIMFADQGAVGCWGSPTGCDATPSVLNSVRADIEQSNFSLVMHVGDLAYAVGNAYLWDIYGTELETVSASVPYMVSIGNHEYDHSGTYGHDPSGASGSGWHPTWGNLGDDSSGECGVPSASRFHAPASQGSNGVFWYSFTYGNVHAVMFSSEHDYTPGSAQFEWLTQDLLSVNRTETPWVIVNTHRPMYTNVAGYDGDYEISLALQKSLEPLMVEAKVDLFLAGHYHSYERSCPVKNQTCCSEDEHCPVYITSGVAGINFSNSDSRGHPWSLFMNNTHHGYQRLWANATTLRSEFVVIDNDPAVLDLVVLRK